MGDKPSALQLAKDIYMQVEDTNDAVNRDLSTRFVLIAEVEPDAFKRRVLILTSLLLLGVNPSLFGLYNGE